jgi:hypothetical protein
MAPMFFTDSVTIVAPNDSAISRVLSVLSLSTTINSHWELSCSIAARTRLTVSGNSFSSLYAGIIIDNRITVSLDNKLPKF